jgi:D-inositol-3-phosphate glycosyltransferase
MLLFVGRIQPLKAPDVLVRAIAELRALSPDLARRVQLVIVGAPSGSGLADPKWLQHLAEHLDLTGQVTHVDPVSRTELADYYRAADLTLVPSHTESFGLVALESQACGTPVLAAAVGGLPTAVDDGTSGVLVSSHDPRAWADALQGLLSRPAERQRLGAGARAHAEHFSWDRTVDGLLRSYRTALTAQSVDLRQQA